ncbi:unnamed protein product [Adineta ricciae]|uniref:B-cell lymphoma 9 beta-catenin binding domain-containing protein n=1 Tax=Adineta ricciae TaxID=249248 RepID=A0A815J1A8_ADIRI|nr:unnamed protein product [Adineta ricciae]CAF1373035.1 unnamed protein product [Adineta ricciae]
MLVVLVNDDMESGTLPPATMLLHSNEPIHPMPSSESPMNQFSDIFSSRPPVQISNKPNKRKLDELSDPSSTDLESLSAIKPQKTEQTEPERSLSRTGTPLSNGPLQHPPPSSTPSRNGNDNGPSSYDFGPASNTNNNNNNNNNIGRTTPNSSLFTQQTPPPPPPSLQQQQPLPTMPPSSYMPMSPRNQYAANNESPFLQTNNQVFVFTTQLANEAAEAVMKNDHPNIIDYHRALPSTTQYLNTLSNNMNNGPNNSLLGGPIHMNHGPPPPGCHSPRTMQMMMGGPGPHNPHLPHPNGGPPPNWPHPHYHPHQQQPPFGRLTPGPGGLPPPNHLMPPGPMMMNGQPPSDGIENLTPERAKHRKNQLNKIEDLKSKITGGRARGGRSKANANAAAAAAAAAANMPPSVNGGPLPPGPLDPHQQQMMMMNSPHGVGPPHHMMGIGPPPPHMLPPGMRGPDGMMLDMNGVPQPHPGYMNGPMPPNFPGQYGPGPGDLYGQLPPPHLQSQAARDWNKMQMEHMEGKGQLMRGQPPPYSSASPSSLTPPIATTSAGGNLGPNGKLLSPKMEPSGAPRLYKVGQPEKFVPDSLPSSVNKKLGGNVGEVQLTASPTQMDYNEFGMEGEELMISRHLNRAYRPSNGVSGGPPIPSSSSSLKDEPMTPMTRSTSTPNNNMNPLSCGQPLTDPGTPTHISQGPPSHLTPSGVSAASPRPGKLPGNSNLSSPLMLSNNPNSSAKDEPLDMNGGPKTPTSNMAPPLSSMLQMTNSLQSANSPYNSSTASSSKPSSLSSNLPGSGPSLASQNLPHMTRSIDQLPPPSHMPLPPHHQQQQQMQFQNMNPHHRMMGMLEPMPPHYNPHHGGNLPPPHPHMYKMMPPHHVHDPSGMMLSHPGGPPRSSKGLPPPSSDPMQQHLHHLPPPHYGKMHNMDPMLGGPPLPGHPQQHMRFPSMMDDGFGMGQPPPPSHHPHHPHMHPHMQPHPQMHHQPMHPNDGRPPPQSINNTYVSTTMSIQQLNIQNLGPGGPPPDLQTGTIHYHASSGNGPDGQPQGPPGSNGNNTMFASQQQFTSMSNMSTNDPSFAPQFNDLQPPPSNLGVDGVQQLPYW